MLMIASYPRPGKRAPKLNNKFFKNHAGLLTAWFFARMIYMRFDKRAPKPNFKDSQNDQK